MSEDFDSQMSINLTRSNIHWGNKHPIQSFCCTTNVKGIYITGSGTLVRVQLSQWIRHLSAAMCAFAVMS